AASPRGFAGGPGGLAASPGGLAAGALDRGARGWRNTSDMGPGAVVGSSAGGGGSSFWMFHHSGHRGGLPPPPRVHFEYPNGSPILNAKYARRKYGRSAQSGRSIIFIASSPRPKWSNRKLRDGSR